MLKKWRSNRRTREPWEDMLIVVMASLFALFVFNILMQQCSGEAHAEAGVPLDAFRGAEPWESEDWIDPMGQSVQPKERPVFPNDKQFKLIGRLTSGIANWKRAQGGWWYCGELIDTEPELTDLAMSVAYNLVRAAARYSANDYPINVWGMAGTAANESRFDACALGLNPRKWAYQKGLLEQRKRCISHTKEEVLAVVTSSAAEKQFGFSGFDLGFCQILTRFYRTVSPSEIMKADIGLDLCAQEMQIRASRYNTDRPWLYWRGRATPWYDDKVRRWARKLGAKAKEI